MISIVNTECHVPKTFSDLAKIAAWGRLGQKVAPRDLQDAAPLRLAAVGQLRRAGHRGEAFPSVASHPPPSAL
jgi:hypothetical protein